MTEQHLAIVTGLLPVGCDRVAMALAEWGWQQVDASAWHRAALNAQGLQSTGWVVQLPMPVSSEQADRLAQLSHAWPPGNLVVADPLATLFWADWQAHYSTARFLLVACAPWVGVAALLRAAADRTAEDPEWAVRVWQTYHEALWTAAQQLGDRATVVDLSARAVEWGDQTLILPDWDEVSDERETLFRQFYPAVADLYDRLNACALVPHQQPTPAAPVSGAAVWLRDWAAAEQGIDRQAQLQQLQQHLAQVEPAFEQSRFQLEQARGELSRYQWRSSQAERAAAEARSRLELLQGAIGIYETRWRHAEDLLAAANTDLQDLQAQLQTALDDAAAARADAAAARADADYAERLRRHAKSQLASAQAQFRELRSRLEETRFLVEAMRGSKFWKLRNAWIALKYKLKPKRLKDFDPELFAQTLVAIEQIPPELAIAPDPAAAQSAIYETVRQNYPTVDLRKPHALLRLFDAAYYLNTQPDVANALPAATYSQAIAHFVANGAAEGRDPSPLFKTRYYLETYPQVRARLAAGDFASAIEHFLEVGIAEGLNPNPHFDSAFYCQTYPDAAAAVEAGQYRSAFEHYLLVGLREARLAAPTESNATDERPLGAIAFISGCGGAPYRYRCLHQAEALRYLGYSVEVYDIAQYPYRELLDRFKVVVMHRPSFHPHLESTITEGRKQGVRFVFETDDLVFDPDLLYQLEDAQAGGAELQQVYQEMMRQYQRAIALVDGVSTSTETLRQSIEQRFPGTVVAVLPNRASAEMERQAALALAQPRPESDRSVVRIGYLSGTKTHQRDFAECVPALIAVAQNHPQTRLQVVGHLEVPPALVAAWGDRLERLPILPWEKLPEVYRRLDINLAPLERDREFTAGKSELKYFEAALLAVPTVASRWGTFTQVIRDGETGFLCGDAAEWTAVLDRLVTDGALREQVGRAANQDARDRYLTRAALGETWAGWHHLLARRPPEPPTLAVGFVVAIELAHDHPVACDRIAALAKALDDRGYDVVLWVEAGSLVSRHQLQQAYATWEARLPACGVRVLDSKGVRPMLDVAIATDWRSACAVADWSAVRLRLHLTQSWEADYLPLGTDEHDAALGACGLPLRPIAWGQAIAEQWEQVRVLRVPPLWIEGGLLPDFLPPTIDWTRHSGPARSLLWLDDRSTSAEQRAAIVAGLSLFLDRYPDTTIYRYGPQRPPTVPFACAELDDGSGWPPADRWAALLQTAELHLAPATANSALPTLQALGCGCAALVVGDELPLGDRLSAGIHYGTLLPVAEAIAQTLGQLATDAAARSNLAKTGRSAVEAADMEAAATAFDRHLRELMFLA